MTDELNIFVPIQKVDAEKREVWGWGIKEEVDQAGEIMDYDSSLPYFNRWSEMSKKRSGGKSLGNVRGMHANIAAGKLISFQPSAPDKGFYLGAQIVDDAEWKKVQSGVYTGFSVGGSYVKRWPDSRNPGAIRYTADPKEWSLVDAPCVAGATFDMVKADGIVKMEFHPEGLNKLVLSDEPDEEGDALEKQIPGVPEPVATLAVGDKPQGALQVEQIPNQFSPLEIKPNAEPAQEVLQTHAVPAKDISAEFARWLPQLQPLIKQLVNDAVAELRKEFDENKHPRDGGKFSAAPGGGGGDKEKEGPEENTMGNRKSKVYEDEDEPGRWVGEHSGHKGKTILSTEHRSKADAMEASGEHLHGGDAQAVEQRQKQKAYDAAPGIKKFIKVIRSAPGDMPDTVGAQQPLPRMIKVVKGEQHE